MLENFGGHTNAVGLTLKEENIPEFKRRLEEYVEQHIEDEQVIPSIDVDCELSFDEINESFVRYIKLFNPFGPENQKPVFMTRMCRDAGTSKLVGKKLEHIKLDVIDPQSGKMMNGIAFGMGEYFDGIKKGEPFDIIYTVEENRHRNNISIQLQIKGIRMSKDAQE